MVRYSICGVHNRNIPYYLYWISQGIWQVIGIVWTKSVSLCSLQRLHNYKMDMEFRGAASPYITVNIRRTTVCRTIFHLNLKVNSYSLSHTISLTMCALAENVKIFELVVILNWYRSRRPASVSCYQSGTSLQNNTPTKKKQLFVTTAPKWNEAKTDGLRA